MAHSRTIAQSFLSLSIAIACGNVALAQSATAVTPAQEATIEAGIKDLSSQWSTSHYHQHRVEGLFRPDEDR